MAEERMLNDEILLGLIKANSGGGGGGTTDYDDLSNKPQIAGTTLSGNKSLADLGIASASELSGILDGANIDSFGDVETALSGKQDTLTFDNAPTENSNNPVKSGGVYTALANKQNTITAGDDLKFSGSTLNVEVSVPYIDEYDLSTNGDNFTVITKKHKGEVVSTDVYPSGIYTTYNIDDCFTLQYGGSPTWIITLTKASTDAPAGTTYGWEYAQTPTVSNIQFELAETGTASEFIADLNDMLASKQDKLTFDDTPTNGSNNPVKSNGIYDALADKTDTDMVATDFNAGTSYTAGNYCVQDGKLYRFKNNHSGAWSAADVEEVKIAGELSSIKRGLIDLSAYFNTKYTGETIDLDNVTSSVIGIFDGANVSGTTPFTMSASVGHMIMVMRASTNIVVEVIIDAYDHKMAVRCRRYSSSGWGWGSWDVNTLGS